MQWEEITAKFLKHYLFPSMFIFCFQFTLLFVSCPKRNTELLKTFLHLKNYSVGNSFFLFNQTIAFWGCSVLPPPGIREGIIFVSSARVGGATAKLQEPGWGHIQGGKMIFGSQAGGTLLYHDELLVFPQNASPWILQISPAALSYIFLTFS